MGQQCQGNESRRPTSLRKVSLKPKPESRTIRIETNGSYVTTPLKAWSVII